MLYMTINSLFGCLQYGDTALHTAARYGHAGVTRILVSAKCNIDDQNKVNIYDIIQVKVKLE